MEWFLSEKKADKIIIRCYDMVNASHTELKGLQKVMGSVNNLAKMCPFIKFTRRSGNQMLASFRGVDRVLKQIPSDVKEELKVVAKVADSARAGLPIPERPVKSSLPALEIYTDAAGASFTMVRGEKFFHPTG